MSGEYDPLFDIKNYYYTGHYDQCIKEADNIKLKASETSEDVILLKDVFKYRSLLAKRHLDTVKEDVTEMTDKRIKPLKIWADYIISTSADGVGNEERRAQIVNQLESYVSSGSLGDLSDVNWLFLIMAVNVLHSEGKIEGALRLINSVQDFPKGERNAFSTWALLELKALKVNILLSIERADLAKLELNNLQSGCDGDENDNDGEDATVTQLMAAALHINMGGEGLSEAYYIYQELIDRYGPSELLINAKAVTHALKNEWDDAQSCFAQLSQQQKDDKKNEGGSVFGSNSLINKYVIEKISGESSKKMNLKCDELIKSLSGGCENGNEKHTFILLQEEKRSVFDRLVRQYSV